MQMAICMLTEGDQTSLQVFEKERRLIQLVHTSFRP